MWFGNSEPGWEKTLVPYNLWSGEGERTGMRGFIVPSPILLLVGKGRGHGGRKLEGNEPSVALLESLPNRPRRMGVNLPWRVANPVRTEPVRLPGR